MRIAMWILVAALAAPGLASAKVEHQKLLPYRGECRKLTRQMEQFADRAQMARKRGDGLWLQSSRLQMARLEARRDRLCPDIKASRVERAWRQAKQIVLAAARTAISYFTFGAY